MFYRRLIGREPHRPTRVTNTLAKFDGRSRRFSCRISLPAKPSSPPRARRQSPRFVLVASFRRPHLFACGLAFVHSFERQAPPLRGLNFQNSSAQSGGNMEGKEVRFGVGGSTLTAVVTSNTATGSYNSMHDSYMSLGGMILELRRSKCKQPLLQPHDWTSDDGGQVRLGDSCTLVRRSIWPSAEDAVFVGNSADPFFFVWDSTHDLFDNDGGIELPSRPGPRPGAGTIAFWKVKRLTQSP